MDGRELLDILDECGIEPDEFGARVNAGTDQMGRWMADKEGLPEQIIWIAELLRERHALQRRLARSEVPEEDVLVLGPGAVVADGKPEHRAERPPADITLTPREMDVIYGEYDDSLGMPSFVDEARDDEDGDRSGTPWDFAEPGSDPEVAMAAPLQSPPGKRGGKAFKWLLVLIVVPSILAGLLMARDMVVYLWPGTAVFYEAIGITAKPVGHGLDIRNVRSERAIEDGADVLVIHGVVVNVSEKPRDVPDIRISLVDVAGDEVQSVSGIARKSRLEAGEATGFEIRLTEPFPSARNLQVGFQRPGPSAGD